MGINLNALDVVMFRPEFRLEGESTVAYNVLYYRCTRVFITATGLPPALTTPFHEVSEDLATNFSVVFGAAWGPAASIKAELHTVSIQNVSPFPASRMYHHILAEPILGQVAGEALPLQDTATILKYGEVGDRHNLGRFFFCGLSETDNNQGYLLNNWSAKVGGLVDFIHADLALVVDDKTYEFQPIIFRPATTNPPVAERQTDIMTATLSDLVIKTQRRRRPGKGI